MSIGPLLIAAPGALLALLILPALIWIMRATPPPPQIAQFPPVRLLLGLRTEQQSRERAPLWLVLLRALMAAALIFAFAKPALSPLAAQQAEGGRTLIVIDDGWTSAPFWSETRAAAEAAAAQAERSGAPVSLLLTAPAARASDPSEALAATDAAARIRRLEPKPWRPDRAAAAARLAQLSTRFDLIIWLTDGLDDPGANALADALLAHGPVMARLPTQTARAIVSGAVTAQGVVAEIRRAPGGAPSAAIAAETGEGRSLGATEIRFAGDALTATARIELPPEIAARATRIRIVGEQSAAAIRLLPAGASRPFVGLVDPGGAGQPLLSELYYVERALAPYATLQRGAITGLVNARVQALIMPDTGRLAPAEASALERWLGAGGLLLRFSGPRLANAADDLLPVRLRPGMRTLGSALAWETPLAIAPFPQDSPYAGITPPSDVSVRRQVLAEPASIAEASVWATLADNSPLVTAHAHGRGLIVLFHVSAAPDWSDLPLSGAYVEMLRRTLAFAARSEGAGQRDIAGGPYVAQTLVDGFGALIPPPSELRPIDPDAFQRATAAPQTPPGLYERAGVTAAIDAVRADEELAPLTLPQQVERSGMGASIERPLAGYFFAAAGVFLALDLLLALFLLGRLPTLHARTAALALAVLFVGAPQAQAQRSDDPTQTLRLAYVRTGDAGVDRKSAAGLQALSDVLTARTSVEPGPPAGVDLARDDLSAYPFLYWPAPASPRPLSSQALVNLDHYLAIGGLLLVDTRDSGVDGRGRPAAIMLSGANVPPLERVTTDHVLARSFYLIRSFPGRLQSTQLWAESAAAAEARDGVASLFIGDGDWASAWAEQREMPLRFGVNLVMVALTGNYKSDQVHVPALLERLGERR